MPKKKEDKLLSVSALRYTEYYGMQQTFDALYAQSRQGKNFSHLMDLITSRENILLAYRNVRKTAGSKTPGTDKTTIRELGKLTPDELVSQVQFILTGSPHGYRPKPVLWIEIPKNDGYMTPLGVPCMWDRLAEQCIRQVLEPICEAKFSNNSYGFRPDRSAENAIASQYKMMQFSHLYFVVELAIQDFFENVDHSKLIRQMWSLGIRDKQLIGIIRRMLQAPVRFHDKRQRAAHIGIVQCGVLAPLMANIVLNEFDQWVDSQWQDHPVTNKVPYRTDKSGCQIRSDAYRLMRKTNLKEMRVVRYGDDIRILCSTREAAERTKHAAIQWIRDRLKLIVPAETVRIVDVREKYTEFLGFKVKVRKKAGKFVVQSHMSDKQLKAETERLVRQAKRIARPSKGRTERDEIKLYNTLVLSIQNYYGIATEINHDCRQMNRAVMAVLTNRLGRSNRNRLRLEGRPLTADEKRRFGTSKMLRYVAGSKEPIYPIGFTQNRKPMHKKRALNRYSEEGRQGIHDKLPLNTKLMLDLMRQPQHCRSAEFADNRLSSYTAQKGLCAVSGHRFESADEVVCHHKVPVNMGGDDAFDNLVLVTAPVHRLIHATREETIDRWLAVCKLNEDQLAKLNLFRQYVGNRQIQR